jgi:hypothetical protein
MKLVRLETGPAGSDLRVFECTKCEHVQQVLVEDPFKSANTGWAHSDLNPAK